MATVRIRNTVLGAGLPKIAVPNVGTSTEEILTAAEKIKSAKPDLMEWRIDYYAAGVNDFAKLNTTARNCGRKWASCLFWSPFALKMRVGSAVWLKTNI